MALTKSADSCAPVQMSNQGDEEEDRSLYAMTAAYYSSHSYTGHNMMRGNDESSYASSFELSREDGTADSTSMPPQVLAYNNQYMGASYPPVGWYASPLPPTSSHYNYHHPTAHHPMYPAYHVPSTYSSAPSAQYQHLHYPSNNESPARHGRVKADYESNEDFILTGDRQRDLRSALYYVRKNPSATLHDIDGKSLFDFDSSNQADCTDFMFMIIIRTIIGFIAEIAKADEGASRFVQRRLQAGKEAEKRLALQAALRSFSDLWPDPFGNFMLQGLLEFGSAEMREGLMTAVFAADVVDMTLNMHG